MAEPQQPVEQVTPGASYSPSVPEPACRAPETSRYGPYREREVRHAPRGIAVSHRWPHTDIDPSHGSSDGADLEAGQ
jgi:hypothetical protein